MYILYNIFNTKRYKKMYTNWYIELYYTARASSTRVTIFIQHFKMLYYFIFAYNTHRIIHIILQCPIIKLAIIFIKPICIWFTVYECNLVNMILFLFFKRHNIIVLH